MKLTVSNRGYIVQISFVNICKIKVNIAQKWMISFLLYSCCPLTEPVSFKLGEVHLWLRTVSSEAPGARGNAVIGSLARFSSVKKIYRSGASAVPHPYVHVTLALLILTTIHATCILTSAREGYIDLCGSDSLLTRSERA